MDNKTPNIRPIVVKYLPEDKCFLAEFESFHNEIIRQLFITKDQMLKDVIKMVLGRDFCADTDIKDFGFVILQDSPEKEYISYKGEVIGEIVPTMKIDETTLATKMGFDFIPVQSGQEL
jgi:hypothetical protein